MSIEHLLRLEIDPSAARNAVRFFESYAKLIQDELRDLRPTPDGNQDEQTERYRSLLTADIVSSYRVAGQWALLLDVRQAARLFQQSGELLRTSGHAFGLFLLASTGGLFDTPRDGRLQHDIAVLAQVSQSGEGTPSSLRISPAMYHPQQQAYLLVALCALPRFAAVYRDRLREICLNSPHREGGTPVGSLGLPIRHYWAVAQALLDGESERFVRQQLMPFINRYMDNVISARSNRHLWNNAAAPVDVGDIDTIGIVSVAARRFGVEVIRSQTRQFDLEIEPRSVEIMLLEIGMELSGIRPLGRHGNRGDDASDRG